MQFLVVSESSHLSDRTTNRNRHRVIRARVGTGAGPGPVAETVAARRFGADRNRRSAIFPPAAGRNGAAGTVAHRQVVLCVEGRRVGLVGGGSYSMRDFSAITPIFPDILNARSTGLRRGCRNRVSRTLGPGKCLR